MNVEDSFIVIIKNKLPLIVKYLNNNTVDSNLQQKKRKKNKKKTKLAFWGCLSKGNRMAELF